MLVSIAFTPLTRLASRLLADSTTPTRFRSQVAAKADARYPAVAVAVAVLVLVPSLVFHLQPANHRMPPLADRDGSRVLAGLPPNSVLFIEDADWAFPPIYRQVVDRQRRDVTVVNLDSLGLDWYRDQLTRALKVTPPSSGAILDAAVTFIQAVRRGRPVYLDTSTMQLVQERLGYRVDGLVAALVSGKGPQPVSDLAGASADLQAIDRADGIDGHANLRFPNDPVLFFHERAHIELAKVYVLAHDTAGAVRELERGIAIYPDDPSAPGVLRFLQQGGKGADKIVLQM